MSDRFIVNVCLTGTVPSKQMNPYVPMTPEEIAKDVEACIELGASIFHVHARDEEQRPDWRKETYENIFKAIRRVSKDVVICASTTGRRVEEIEKRTACLDADPRPDMASLTTGSLNFMTEGMLNSPQTILALIQAMHDRGIKPEIEIFDIGMARTAARLIADGTFRPPYYINILLGNIATADASLLDLATILQHLPKEVVWCAAGIGKTQLKANALGILFGSGVRVGLEDNLYINDDKTPATNAALVERVVEIGKLLGKTPSSIAETRERLWGHPIPTGGRR
jgi:3-keto-5-aminohexanoate cleavage enzyme